jgi:hypothetical protein
MAIFSTAFTSLSMLQPSAPRIGQYMGFVLLYTYS